MIHPLIILGSGPAGLTAAVYASRAGLKPIVFEGSTPGGQLMGTSYVENWPGISRVLGPQLMMDMRAHAEHFGAELRAENIVSAQVNQAPFTLTSSTGATYQCHALIIATGATPKRLGCPGEDQYWGKGVTTCAVCDGAFYKDKPVIIVGGGDSAMEDASFMTHFTDRITVVHIGDTLTASKAMQERVVGNPQITIRYNSTVTAIHGDGTHVTGATITNQKTGATEDVGTDAVFVAIGLSPNTGLFRSQLTCTDYGYLVQVDHTQTSVPGVFAAGDVADSRYRQAITSAGSGCMAALDAESYLKQQGLR